MTRFVLPFEKPVQELIDRVRALKVLASDDLSLVPELARLEEKAGRAIREIFSSLTPMQIVQLSRHPQRPYTLDYLERLVSDWVELHGDRRFADDPAIVAGMGTYHGRSVVVVGHQKGRGTNDNVVRNFGMPHPEGYRKAIRVMDLAARFRLPVITFIDTPGAYPGIGAEERGQSEAIASSIACMTSSPVPSVAVIIGEGGSGGALGLGVANRVLMMEYSCYSVISPEGCAAILWKDASRAPDAAQCLRLTAPELLDLGVIDQVIQEPPGGSHQDPERAAYVVDRALREALASLDGMSAEELMEDRYQRYRCLGAFAA